MIRAEVHDIAARLFFVSGSPGLVNTMKGVLGAVGVKRGSIRTACFPGYPS